MATLILIVMILSGLLFIGSVLLMTPKGGIGFGIGGMATSNEYGSKKSIENTLKKSALINIIVFTACAMVYPYVNKANLSTGKAQAAQIQKQLQTQLKNLKTSENVKKISPKDVQIEGVNTKWVKITTESSKK